MGNTTRKETVSSSSGNKKTRNGSSSTEDTAGGGVPDSSSSSSGIAKETTPLLKESLASSTADTVGISTSDNQVGEEDREDKNDSSDDTNFNGQNEDVESLIEEMTMSRRIAMYLSQFSWYCPISPHHLRRGWYYYEHYTLARHEGRRKQLASSGSSETETSRAAATTNFVRANRGEQSTKTYLYPVLETPETDLADFGQGIGIYFYALRMLSYLLLAAGVMSIPNLIFFGSTDWNPNFEFSSFRVLRTSAVCTTQPWKACPNCTRSDWSNLSPPTYDRYAETSDGKTFIRINDCDITRTAGMVGLITMTFVVLGVWLISKAADNRDSVLDHAQQTTRDYGVQVRNPPKDASDPDEWKTFFSQFGHVTSTTIVKDNDKLLMKLLERRQFVSQLEDILPSDVEIDPNDLSKAVEKSFSVSFFSNFFMGMLDGQTIYKKVEDIDELIKNDLSKQKYEVSEVFVIFEKEADQQAALSALQVPLYAIHRNKVDVLEKKEYLFRSSSMLLVNDPPEPSDVIWENLDYTFFDFIRQRTITFFMTSICIVFCCFFVIYIKTMHGTVAGAFAISLVTSTAVSMSKYIIRAGEAHPTQESRQISLYNKVTGFQWVLATFLTQRITPFTETLANKPDSLIPAMYAIFITEMIKAPIKSALDIRGNIQKHILAPRSPSLKKITTYFKGTTWDLADRYTDLSNVMLMSFYYSLLFAAAYFLAGVTLFIHYWVDKFCLLRVWKPAPKFGFGIGRICRDTFWRMAIIVFVMRSSYNYASFPFDNSCPLDTSIPSEYIGTFTAVDGNGAPITVEILEGDEMYDFCNQNIAEYKLFAIPANQPDGREWMSDAQHFSRIFGMTSFWLMVVALVSICRGIYLNLRFIFFKPTIDFKAWKSPRNFCDVADASAYIPEGNLDTDPFPVLFCDTSQIPRELLSWVDPTDPIYKKHCAIYDVTGLADTPVFSTVHFFPPKGKEAVRNSSGMLKIVDK